MHVYNFIDFVGQASCVLVFNQQPVTINNGKILVPIISHHKFNNSTALNNAFIQ